MEFQARGSGGYAQDPANQFSRGLFLIPFGRLVFFCLLAACSLLVFSWPSSHAGTLSHRILPCRNLPPWGSRIESLLYRNPLASGGNKKSPVSQRKTGDNKNQPVISWSLEAQDLRTAESGVAPITLTMPPIGRKSYTHFASASVMLTQPCEEGRPMAIPSRFHRAV